MTDEELIARLRDGCNLQQRDGERAADRIEALTKGRDEADDLAKAAFADGASNNIRLAETSYRVKALTKERDAYASKLMQANNTYTEMHLEIERLSDKLATCEKYRDAYAEMGRIGTQAVRDLEAKLAALLDAAEKVINSYWDSTDGVITGIYDLEAALARVKGESNDLP